jgi:hypothetical protein
VEFEEALRRFGFRLEQDRRAGGVRAYAATPNRFLTYWVHTFDDGTALFTWEFDIVDYLLGRGMQLGSSEQLNLFLFPVEDLRGPQDAAWLAHAMELAEARLRGVDLADPERE